MLIDSDAAVSGMDGQRSFAAATTCRRHLPPAGAVRAAAAAELPPCSNPASHTIGAQLSLILRWFPRQSRFMNGTFVADHMQREPVRVASSGLSAKKCRLSISPNARAIQPSNSLKGCIAQATRIKKGPAVRLPATTGARQFHVTLKP